MNADVSPQTLEEIQAAVDDGVDFERRTYAPEPEEATTGETAFSSKRILEALGRNEDGDASLFIDLNRGRLVFDHAAGVWHVFDGHWEQDATEQALSKVSEVADLYLAELHRQSWARIGAEKSRNTKAADQAEKLEKALARRARELHTVRRRQDVLHLARAGAGTLGISGNEWDANPMSLPVQNGVVSLRTGAFRDGKPEDYFKTYAPTPWEGRNAPCPAWEAFLESTFDGDGDLVAFMGRLLGYSITGKTTEAVLPILWGSGRNGKTVLLQAMADALGGDLAGPVEGEMLLESRYKRPSGGPSSDLLHLRGKRLTWLSEPNENRRLNSGKVKLLTGGDLITGRAPYAARQITFKPTHKIFLLTNHRPKADAQDTALWHRVLLIPFGMAFLPNPDPAKENERLADPDLAEKLRSERPGILAWLVRGCLEWQRQGLNPPESVRAATNEYRDGEDTLKTFLQDRCTEGPGQTVRADAFFKAYQAWTEGNGEQPVTSTKFGRYMGALFDFTKDRTGKFYIGVGLL
jgi:putative DNA primase/helicase